MLPLKDEITVVSLLNALKNPNSLVRQQAVHSLGRCALEGPVALRQFSKALTDRDPAVRRAAVPALGRLGPPAMSVLVTALSDPDRGVRREAVWALGRLGSLAVLAAPALAHALEDGDGRVRQGAARALGLIGPAAQAAIPHLIRGLYDTTHLLPRLAAWALGQIGPAAVPALVAALQAPDAFVRADALWALAEMGSAAKAAVPALVQLLRTEKERCLTAIAPAAESTSSDATGPVYIRPRRGTEEAWLVQAIKTLAAIGPDARAAIPDLRELTEQGWGTMQVSAADAICSIRRGDVRQPAVS